MSAPKPAVKYANLGSRLFLKPLFENQWVIPDPPPRVLENFLQWYERRMLKIDLTGIAIDRPIFLISLPRCGSSMLQDVICGHSQVAYITNMMHTFRSCFGAAEHFRRKLGFNVRGERFLKDSVEVDGGSPADPVATWAEWFKQDPYSLDYVELRARDLAPADIESVRDAIRKVIWCFGGKATRFECKTPALLPHALLLQELFPDARFIHLVRDARASANSLLKLHRLSNEQLVAIRARQGRPAPTFVPYPRMPRLADYVREFGADDIRTTAHLWNDGIDFIRDNRSSFAHFHEIRYEDILADPRRELLRILEFCELPVPAAADRNFWGKLDGVGVVHHTNRYADFDVVEGICRENMQRYGYL